jgi:hypothetical protein
MMLINAYEGGKWITEIGNEILLDPLIQINYIYTKSSDRMVDDCTYHLKEIVFSSSK